MGLNKGEWSELYAIFHLLVNRKLKLIDCKFNILSENIFVVQSILTKRKNGEIKFEIKDNEIIPTVLGIRMTPIKTNDINIFKTKMFNSISEGGNGSGSFDLKDVTNWLKERGIQDKFKALSRVKEDLFLFNLDTTRKTSVMLGYSVKSQLGSPATILNASNHTNFKYQIIGFKEKYIPIINKINTGTKLLDKIKSIEEYGGKIIFHSIESKIFTENLQMIDMLLPSALGEVLINSYRYNEKNLLSLFQTSTIYNNKALAEKK